MDDSIPQARNNEGLFPLVISGLFHPLLIPTYMFLLLLSINPFLFGANRFGDERAVLLLIMIFLYTFVIPAVSIGLMRALGMLDSIMMEDRMQRIGPLLLVMILYFWVFYNFSQDNDTPAVFTAVMLGVVISLAVCFVVNVMDKISLHTTGMGGLVGMSMICLGLYGDTAFGVGGVRLGLGLVVLFAVLLAGVVASSRKALGAHTNAQLLAGFLVGFFAQWIGLNLYF